MKTTSEILGISEAEFIATYQLIQESDRADELRLADQGQLLDIFASEMDEAEL